MSLILNKLTHCIKFAKSRVMVRNRLPRYTLALSALTLFTASVSFAGDGGGINGPSLNGSSIPAALEGGIVWKDISKALTECYISGYGKGSRSLVSRLAEEVFGSDPMQPDSTHVLQYSSVYEEIFDSRYSSASGGAYPADHCTANTDDCLGRSPLANYLRLDATITGAVNVRIQHPIVNNMSRVTQLALRDALVAIKWDSVTQICDGYDALGDCVNRREYFINVKVRPLFRELGRPADATLYNVNTRQPTALTVNGNELYDCLQTRLGSASRP